MKYDEFDTENATKLTARTNSLIAAMLFRTRRDQPARKARDVVVPTTLMADDFFAGF